MENEKRNSVQNQNINIDLLNRGRVQQDATQLYDHTSMVRVCPRAEIEKLRFHFPVFAESQARVTGH